MITLSYSLIIEATEDPDFFGFYSTDLEGFTGIGHSIEDCLYKARWGMADHTQMLATKAFRCQRRIQILPSLFRTKPSCNRFDAVAVIADRGPNYRWKFVNGADGISDIEGSEPDWL